MFYNYCRSTRACLFNEQQKKKLKKRQISLSHSPNSRLMNLQKRQKLKNLLMMKFMEKYNINYPEQSIEKEITKHSQGIMVAGGVCSNGIGKLKFISQICRKSHVTKNLPSNQK